MSYAAKVDWNAVRALWKERGLELEAWEDATEDDQNVVIKRAEMYAAGATVEEVHDKTNRSGTGCPIHDTSFYAQPELHQASERAFAEAVRKVSAN